MKYKKLNEKGFIAVSIMTMLALSFFISLFFVKAEVSEQNVSGIVYNNKNNAFFTGNTTFSVRAAEDTYVSVENQSSFCLPANSPYKEIVNKAAADKKIRVVVTTKKFFKFGVAPWTCVDNVTVEEQK